MSPTNIFTAFYDQGGNLAALITPYALHLLYLLLFVEVGTTSITWMRGNDDIPDLLWPAGLSGVFDCVRILVDNRLLDTWKNCARQFSYDRTKHQRSARLNAEYISRRGGPNFSDPMERAQLRPNDTQRRTRHC